MAGNLTAMIAAAFSGSAAPPVTSDPYYEYTTLLLPGNGTNGAQNNTFLDSSTNNFTITRNGHTTQGTFSPFSQTGWGNYFGGSSSYLQVANNTNLQLGSSDFTIEFWFYSPQNQNNSDAFASGYNSGSNLNWLIAVPAGNDLKFYASTSGTGWAISGLTIGTLVNNQWNHVAITRNGNTVTTFFNGQIGATSTALGSSSLFANTAPVTIGTAGDGLSSFNVTGYFSNFRIVKGRAVYTSAFTPPTSPLTRTTGGTNPPQGTECSLLTCQSNRFLDSNGVNIPASSPLTITVNGDTSVQAFSPFNPSASWSAATYGGSGYFDGTGDYLSAASNAAFTLGSSTDFCVEAWIYSTGTPGTDAVIAGTWQNGSSAFANRWLLSLRTSGTVIYWWDSTGSPGITYTGITTNQWVHIAVARSSSTITLYVNGVSRGTQTTNQAYTTQDSLKIGGGITGTADFPGYISNFRLVVGSPVYTSAFTPPTAPLTAITNTSLLLNCTNAGIYDATSKNVLETVDGAKISTAISAKWGSGCMAFDGTGDYLLFPSNELYAFGTGDFTLEAWVYWNNINTAQTLFDFRPNATGSSASPYIELTSSGTLIYYVSGSVRITTSAVSANSWTYVALVRSASNTKIYINGSQSGSTYPDTNNYLQSGFAIGLNRNNGGVAFQYLNGYIQDLRITKGYARYTANFTAPTAAFPTL